MSLFPDRQHLTGKVVELRQGPAELNVHANRPNQSHCHQRKRPRVAKVEVKCRLVR